MNKKDNKQEYPSILSSLYREVIAPAPGMDCSGAALPHCPYSNKEDKCYWKPKWLIEVSTD